MDKVGKVGVVSNVFHRLRLIQKHTQKSICGAITVDKRRRETGCFLTFPDRRVDRRRLGSSCKMQRSKHQNPDITNTGDLLRRCAYGSEETKRQSQRSTIFADKPMQVCLPHDKTRVRNRRRLEHRGKQRREEPSRLPRSRRLIYVREIMALRVECTDEAALACWTRRFLLLREGTTHWDRPLLHWSSWFNWFKKERAPDLPDKASLPCSFFVWCGDVSLYYCAGFVLLRLFLCLCYRVLAVFSIHYDDFSVCCVRKGLVWWWRWWWFVVCSSSLAQRLRHGPKSVKRYFIAGI